ncbi:MAG TPA: ABC transporter permease [Spirochaetia bacterium]|nr:ABC transporter permease [Spirochaetia bacterium]
MNSRMFPAFAERAKRSYQTPLALVALLVIWQGAVMIFRIPDFILPSPLSAISHLVLPQTKANYRWHIQIWTTLSEVLISFGVTAVLGVLIAVVVSWSRTIRNVAMPAFIFINSLPIIAIAPIILLWFGYGIGTNVLIAFLVSFFPVVINSTKGMSEVDNDLIDLVRYLHASKWQIFLKIRFPNSLPYVFTGLKISSTMCVVGAIVGEFIASDRGLGFIIINSQYTMDTPPIFSALIVVSLIGVGLFWVVQGIERLVMPWNRQRSL